MIYPSPTSSNMKLLHLLAGFFFLSFSTQNLRAEQSWKTEEEAQLVAESMANTPENADKVVPLQEGRTSNLIASMAGLKSTVTDLQGNESSIEDLYANIDDDSANLEDSLARLNAEVTEDEVRIRLETAVLFAFDSSELRPDALQQLSDVLTVIDGYPDFPITIEGHTCSMGTDEYNKKLSVRRATSVKDWLREQKVLKSRLSAQGYGESQPIADNSEEEGRIKNRRVEIVMQKK